MKKITMILLLIGLSCYTVKGQAQLPNASFENWATATWGDSLINWTTSFKLLSDIVFVNKSTVANAGTNAAEINSQSINVIFTTYNIPGIMTLGNIQPDMVNMSAKVVGGIPFTDKPSTLKGWYQYTQQGGDSAIVYVVLTKWNAMNNRTDTVAEGGFLRNSSQPSYTQFAIDLDYQITNVTPDTLNVILLSSGFSATPGSKFLVDNLSFEYPSTIEDNSKLDCYIYPNPSTGIINVSLAQNTKTTATLFNCLGQVVYTKSLYGLNSVLDVSSMPKGVYLLELKNDNQREIKKITLK